MKSLLVKSSSKKKLAKFTLTRQTRPWCFNILQAAAEISRFLDSKTLIVASSDFTHYGPRFGYVPFRDRIPENLRKLDDGAIENILSKDYKGFMDYYGKTGITICGFRPIGILLNLLPADTKAHLLNYDTSGRILDEYRNSVSYVSILFTKP